jgi:hypothetical protein
MASRQGYSTNTGLSAAPEVDATKYPDVYTDNLKIRNAIKVLQNAIDIYCGADSPDPSTWGTLEISKYRLQYLTRGYALATEDINAGQLINVYSSAGDPRIRLANATAVGKPAHGFATTSVKSGAFGEFVGEGVCRLISGLTPGVTYYLSNTAGLVAAGAGTVLQRVGFAVGQTALIFRPDLV